jgi:hypothetical protein
MDHPVRKTSLVSAIAGLSLAAAAAAFAQEKADMPLPPDINPVSLTRLPPLTRADLDEAGKAVYDRIVGDGPAPTTGPVAVSLYSPKIAAAFSDLNGFLRYMGDRAAVRVFGARARGAALRGAPSRDRHHQIRP